MLVYVRRFFWFCSCISLLWTTGSLAAQESASSPTTHNLTLTSELLKKTEAEIASSFRAYSFDERQDKSQLVQLYLEPKLQLHLSDDFKFRARGSLSLSTARVQARFDDPSFNTMNLNELVISYEPSPWFNLELGALDQGQLNSIMLVDEDRAFPGAMLKSGWQGENTEVLFRAQYSIPNSVSLEMDRTGEESLPTFATQGVDVSWKPLDWAKLSATVHHFTYRNLPSVVAFQSGRLGNEVIGDTTSESYFAYAFDGFAQNLQLDLDLHDKIKNRIQIQVIDNLEAPSDRSRSQWTGLAFDLFFKDMIVSPELAYFYAESDSVPALYSAVKLGRNNREGMFYSLKVHFQKLGLSVKASYVNANLIEPDPIQNKLNAFEFLVELPSVKF